MAEWTRRDSNPEPLAVYGLSEISNNAKADCELIGFRETSCCFPSARERGSC